MSAVNRFDDEFRLRWNRGDVIPMWLNDDPTKGREPKGYDPPNGEWLRFVILETGETKIGLHALVQYVDPMKLFNYSSQPVFITQVGNAMRTYHYHQVKSWTTATNGEAATARAERS